MTLRRECNWGRWGVKLEAVKRRETSRDNVKQQRLATPYAHAGRFCGTSLRDAFARRRYLSREFPHHGGKPALVSCRVVVMDQILSGGAIEQPRGHPIRRTRLLGRRGGAHALEGGAERGALSTVTYLAGAPLAHRLLRRLDSRHSRPPREARKIEGKCRSVKALRR